MMGFLQTGRALYVLAVICFGGIFVRLAAGSFYKKLIKESANMALTSEKFFCFWKKMTYSIPLTSKRKTCAFFTIIFTYYYYRKRMT